MKLHLPNLLRKAVLACMASFVVLHSTVASATLTQVATMADLVATGTLGTGVTNTSGAGYTSYSFTGEGAITGITSTAVLDAITSTSTTNYVTIAAWVNPADNDGVQSIFGYGAQSNGFKFAVNGSGLQYTAKGVSVGGDTTAQGTNVTAGSWSLVAITFCLDNNANDRYLIGTADGGYWSGQNMKNVNEPAAGEKTFAIGSGNSGDLREGYSGEIQNLTIFTSDGLVTNPDLVEVMGSTAPSDAYEPDISDLPQQVYTGATNNNIDLSTYADGHQLVFALETTGSGNWFTGNSAQVVNSDVHIGSLDGSRTTGLAMTNGNSDNHQIFTGKVTGRGIIHKSSGGTNSAISFTGDTTGFNGNIFLNPSATFTLTFGTVVTGTGDSAVTYTATPGASSAESGIIGNGSISINGAGYANLVFNYDAGDTPIYITNNFTFGSGTTANRVQLNGAADYVIAGEVDVAYLNRFQANTTGKVTFEKATANVTGSETVATTAALSRANDTLYKKGSGTYKLAHDVEFANIVVKQGTLHWQSGGDTPDAGTTRINATKLTLESGTVFKIDQNVGDHSHLDIVTKGGEIFSNDLKNFATFGTLDMQADATLRYTYNADVNFTGITGTGNLTIDVSSGANEEGKVTSIGNVHDYTGTVSITSAAQGKGHAAQLGIGTVTLSEGKSLALDYDVTSTNFAKYGAGALTLNGNLTINGRFDAFYEGTITQAEGKSISVTNNSTLVCRENGTGSRLSLAALPDSLLLDLKGVSETAARAGIDLGLAYSADLASKLQVSGSGAGKVFADYFSVTNDGGKAKLTLTGAAAEASEWDANWGVHAMVSAPVGLAATTVADGELALHNTGDSLNYVAINATGGGDNAVIYGGRNGGGGNYVSNEEVWIKASSGKFLGLVGGSRAVWGGYNSLALNADTHILVDGAEVDHVIGGFFQECHNPVLTGDTYISIKSGSITGNIVGSSILKDGDNYRSGHNGNSHVYIYTPLNNTTDAAQLPGQGAESVNNIITGGALGVYNNDQKFRVARYTMVGDTDVVVDLNSYSGSETGFKKAIYGGSHIVRPGRGQNDCSVVMDGNTNVTITGAGSITFAGDIVGGSHIQGGAASISGTSSVSIDGGTYAGMVVGGSIVEAKSTTTVGGTSVKLSGGTYQQNVIGGTHAKAGAATASVGNVAVSISGNSSVAGTLVGGHYIAGTEEEAITASTEEEAITASVGNINIDMTGGTVAKLVGGSYVERNAAGSTVKQGDVTLNLEGGSITGNVYAAGSQQGSTTISTGNVAVKLGSALAMTGDTITAGYELAPAPAPANAAAGSTITGSRTLELVGSQDRSGVTIDQFDTIKVTEADTTAKVGSITGVTGLTKTGAGALQMGGSTLESLTVSEGAVALTGENTLGSISVAENAGLDLSGATTLGADITLANNTGLVGGAADMGGKALTLGTGLNITGTEVDGIITLMSNVGTITGITFDAAGMAAVDGILASINGVQEIAGWSFAKEGNTLTLVNPALMVQNMEWSQADSAYWQNGQEFDGAGSVYEADKKYNVTFGALTGTSSTAPEFVQVNGSVAADSMVVDGGEGQVYVFRTDGGAGSGITAVTKGIELLSGTAVFEAGTLAMTEDTTLTVAGSTLVLHHGAVVNQAAVDIILGNAGTLTWAAGNTTDYSLNGGLSIAEGATEVTLDMGANVVQLDGEIQGTVSGVTLNVVGNGTLEARPGVLGTAKVVVNGVDLSLASDVEYAASFANTASESMSIAASAGKETTLSGDNSGFAGEVLIGAGSTLALKGAAALGGDMALTGTGNVAFVKKDGAAGAEFTLTADDVYTGTTTVREGATLNWGGTRSGDIILDEGSTLKLSSAVENVIRDGLDVNAAAPGTVVLTSTKTTTTDASGTETTTINPIEWNSTSKTYTGETVVSADTIVETTGSLSAGNGTTAGRVHLSAASSVLKITNAAWDGSWTAGHNVYGAGTVLLESDDATNKTFTDVLLDGIVAAGDGNALANLEIATGNTLKQTTGLNATTGPVYKNIQTITVQDGATYQLGGNYLSNEWKNTIVLSGTGVDGNGALVLAGPTTKFASNITLAADATIQTKATTTEYKYGVIDGGKTDAFEGYALTFTTDDITDNSNRYIKVGDGSATEIRNLKSLTWIQDGGTNGNSNGIDLFSKTSISNVGSVSMNAVNLWMKGSMTAINTVDITTVKSLDLTSTSSIAGTGTDTSALSLTATTGDISLHGDNSAFRTVTINGTANILQDSSGSLVGTGAGSSLSVTTTTTTGYLRLHGDNSGYDTVNLNSSNTFQQNGDGSFTGVSKDTSTLSLTATTSAELRGNISTFKTLSIDAPTSAMTSGTKSDIGTIELKSGVLTYSGGTFTNIGTLDVADGATFKFKGDGNDLGGADVVLNHGAKLVYYHDNNSENALHIDSLTVKDDPNATDKAVTIQQTNHQSQIVIDELNGSGTLVLDANQSSSVLGTVAINGGAFDGTITLTQTNQSTGERKQALQSSSETALQSAIVEFGPFNLVNIGAGTRQLSLDVQGSLVKVEGIKTGTECNKAYSTWLKSNATGENMNTLEIRGSSEYAFAGNVDSNLTVKMSGTGKQTLSGQLAANSAYTATNGTLAISGKGQSGSHTFTAAGGTLDLGGYAADTNATLDDTIVAAGGTVKGLTLGAGMLLEQTAASTLEGALTLAGGKMAFDLTKTTANGATTYGVGTQYSATTAGASLVIDSTQTNSLLFRTDDLLGYIDANHGSEITGQEGRYYSLITGLTSVSVGTQAITDGENITASLGTNFSNDGRAQHSIVVMEQKDDAGTGTGKFDLMLKVIGAPAILEWTGENGTPTPADATAGTPAMLTGTWDTKGTDNWQIQGGTNATDDMFYSDDSVVFGNVQIDDDGDPATEPVTALQEVMVHQDGVSIGSMKVTGGQYHFTGGDITSVEGMGNVTITGGEVTFDNSIDTDGKLEITGGNVTFNESIATNGELLVSGGTAVFNGSIANEGNLKVRGGNVTLNAENTYIGNTEIASTSGTLTIGHAKALGATTMKDGTTPTSTTVDGKMIFNIADASNNVVANRIKHHWGHIFAQNNVTLSDVWLNSDGSNKYLSAAAGKELIVTVNSSSVQGTNLNIGNWSDTATGTVTLTATKDLSSLKNIIVERGTFNATFQGNVSNGSKVEFMNASTGSMTFQGSAALGNISTNNGALSMSFGAESTVGNIRVANNANAKLTLGVTQGKAASVLNAGTVTTQSLQQTLDVTGGLTLKTALVEGQGTVKLVGSTLDYSGSNLDAKLSLSNQVTLKSSYANGSTTVTSGKTITLEPAGVVYMQGNWTLNPTTVVWAEGSTNTLVMGSDSANTANVTLTGDTTMVLASLVNNSTLTAAAPAADQPNVKWILGAGGIAGTVSNIDIEITGMDTATYATVYSTSVSNGANLGNVKVNYSAGNVEKGNIGLSINGSDGGSTRIADLDIVSGKATLSGTASAITIGSIEVDGEKAIMNYNGNASIAAAVTTTLYEGALAGAGSWTGLVNVVDTVEGVDSIRSYDMGGITSAASVNIGSLNVDAAAGEYSRLTNVGSLQLVGENSITLIDAMTNGDSLFGTTGAVTLAAGDANSLHIDINSVLQSLLGATEGTPKVTEFNLGGDLSGLAGKANVIFDTALNLYNLAATFGTDGKLTLTQNVPMEEGSYYDAAAKQGDSTAWVGNGAEELYDSAEGYSAILVNKDTVIDLTGDGVSAAGQADKPGLGMVLNNVNGTADLSIAGNGDDLVTISNTVKNIKLSGDVSVADTDVQILHTKEAHVADDASVLTVDTLSTDTASELKLVAGKLALAEDGSALLGGVTVADGGHAQLVLNGDTTLGGTIATANAAEMLRATGVQWDIDLSNAADVENVALGAGKTATLADGAVVESGVGMKGAEGSTLKLAEGATATISQAASLTGMALEVAEGTELKVDAANKGGDLSFTDATIAGKLSSMTSDATVSAEAGINLSATKGSTSTISGDLSGYTGWLALKGAGSYKMTTDAAGTSLSVEGSTTTIEAGKDGVISLRSLLLTDNGTLNLDMASDRNVSNKKLNTTEGVTLADGTMNLTANLSKVTEGGVVFTGGKVTVEEGATINLTVNRVSDAVAEDLLSNGASSITLAEVAEGDADVTVINEDQRMSKYFHNAVVKVVDGKLVLTGDVVDGETADYHKQLAETENGKAGASMLDEAYGSSMKEINAAESDVKSMLTYMEDLIAAGNTAGMDEALAAVAGSSTAVLGMAAAGDVERQLKAIRNRTTTMGVDQSVLHEELPYLNAWINAEGDHREMNDDGTLGGYKLNSWGGTVGFDADLTPTFTAGMALTAMYGDLDATGADKATGNMDSYYVSAFARYCGSAWTHTFVGTIGKSDITLDRTVNYGGGSYKTEGETNAMSFGVMYEVGRVFALNEDATTCLQPIFNVTWRHTTVDAYTEKSKGDAALSVDEQTVDTVTFGLGARLQTVVGESIYNRTSILECRVLAKADTGDSSSATSTALKAYNEAKQDVESAEKGNFGVEAGMGLTIPVGQENASIFMDASVELRADYTNVNGTVGYRVNF